MADSTSNIDNVQQSQSSKEITINAFFDAASPAAIYGRRQSTTSGLTFGYYGGRWGGFSIANGTQLLGGSTTTYFSVKRSDGTVNFSTAATNWNDSTNYARAYKLVTSGSAITSWEDHRAGAGGVMGGGGGSGDVVGPASATSGHVALFDGATGKLIKDGGALGALAAKSSVAIGDISATGTPSSSTYLRGDGTWSAGGGGASDFTDLGDVPASYSGAAGKFVAVNVGATALEFVSAPGGGDVYLGATNAFTKTQLGPVTDLGSRSTDYSLDASTTQTLILTLADNITITWSSIVKGATYTLLVTQDGTGSRTLSWAGATVTLPTGATIASGANKTSVISLVALSTSVLVGNILQVV
jgi:hypothetical protein